MRLSLIHISPQQMELEEKGQTDDMVSAFKEEDAQHLDYTKHTLWENEKQRPASFTFRLGSGAYELHEDCLFYTSRCV